MREGLTDPATPMGEKLAASFAIEHADWDVIKIFTDDGKRMTDTDVTRIQAKAIHWVDEQMLALSSL